MTLIKEQTICKICKSNLNEFLSLGETPPANAFLKKEDFSKEKSYPLRVGFCQTCHLVQLMDVISRKHLFSHYVYFYSAMPTASKHFSAYTQEVISRFIKEPQKDFIVEIGSNDGLLLKAFQDSGCSRVLGVDPAKNIAEFANQQGVPTIADFFSKKLAREITGKEGRAQVIIGNNVVAHIDDVHDLVQGVNELLDESGVFIFEAPYLMDMFENLAYDSIYHEHLSYLAVAPLMHLFGQYGMELFDVKIVQRQGNSIRVFVCRKGTHPVAASVSSFLKNERKSGLDKLETYQKLAERIYHSRDMLKKTLAKLKRQGKTIATYGAPARGNTILNFCGINNDIVDFATEELSSKIGFYTPGTHIPVKDIHEARENPPDYYVMLAWSYKEAIIKKEKEFIKRGGKFIVPIGDNIHIL